MDNGGIVLLIGFIGVLLGSITSIVVILIQSWYENKRSLTQKAIDLAIEDYRVSNEHAKLTNGSVFPLSLYVHYHTRIMEYAIKGELTKENLQLIGKEQDELRQLMIDDTKRLKGE